MTYWDVFKRVFSFGKKPKKKTELKYVYQVDGTGVEMGIFDAHKLARNRSVVSSSPINIYMVQVSNRQRICIINTYQKGEIVEKIK